MSELFINFVGCNKVRFGKVAMTGTIRSGKIEFRKRLTSGVVLLLMFASHAGFSSCSRDEDRTVGIDEDILVSVGDSSLTKQDVLVRIPGGLESQDSAALFHSIVSNWVESMLLEEIALKNLDDAEIIDKLVEDYRRKLIVSSYIRQLSQREGEKAVSSSRIRKYYLTHSDEMKTTEPLVKGIYLKVTEGSSNLNEIRRRMKGATAEDIDYLEKYFLGDAVQYDNLNNRWVEFREIAERIPYRMDNRDNFVKTTKDFETSHNGFVYLLHISDYLPAGSEMPYEYAAEQIAPILEDETVAERKNKIIKTLYDRAVNEGVLRAPGYDLFN